MDLDRFRQRLSLIQAKNKQINERVNTELDRKFKKSLASSQIKSSLHKYMEKIAMMSPQSSVIEE